MSTMRYTLMMMFFLLPLSSCGQNEQHNSSPDKNKMLSNSLPIYSPSELLTDGSSKIVLNK